jgi:hypothetical protein
MDQFIPALSPAFKRTGQRSLNAPNVVFQTDFFSAGAAPKNEAAWSTKLQGKGVPNICALLRGNATHKDLFDPI